MQTTSQSRDGSKIGRVTLTESVEPVVIALTVLVVRLVQLQLPLLVLSLSPSLPTFSPSPTPRSILAMKLFALTAFTSLIAYASAVPTVRLSSSLSLPTSSRAFADRFSFRTQLSSRSTELVVRANSTLTTCQAVTLDWASDLIPAGENIHWEISGTLRHHGTEG